MRKKIVAGNWKMNPEIKSGTELVAKIMVLAEERRLLNDQSGVRMIICPPFIMIPGCISRIGGNRFISAGAQNCYTDDKGAFTGEISAPMLKEAGIEYVIIGHSERRSYFGESHEFLRHKVDAALRHQLKPIFCCGEVLEQRQQSKHTEVVKAQLHESLFHLDATALQQVIIAYEPVWAIGTGLTATPGQAQEMHEHIRGMLRLQYGWEVAAAMPILYGGSCNAKNARELFALPDVDGGLIGGASLKADEFVEIASIASNLTCQI